MSGLSDLPAILARYNTAGKQVILKSDFVSIIEAFSDPLPRASKPPLAWIDAATVRVEATANSPARMQLSGFPNILSPSSSIDGGLCDGGIRTNTTNVSCIFTAGGIYGTEQSSQWYAIFATAADVDTTFALKGMPWMRVKSQATQTIKTGTLTTPATGINYAFTNDEFIGGKIYFLSGTSKGLLRTITANNVDTDTTITYSGAPLTVTAGDWFIILPNTNFRWLGGVWNNSSGDIRQFGQQGNTMTVMEATTVTTGSITGPLEWIAMADPLAVNLALSMSSGSTCYIGHPDAIPNYTSMFNYTDVGFNQFVSIGIKLCTLGINGTTVTLLALSYDLPE